jgi:nitrous oxidase accessory protein NosD
MSISVSGAQRNTAFYRILPVLLVFSLLLVSPAAAKIFVYNGTGAIQDLIENSSNGDSIFLSAGTYVGNIIIDRSLIFGAMDSADPPLIVTSGTGAGLTLSSNDITISGISVLGNASTGILVASNDSQITGNTVSFTATNGAGSTTTIETVNLPGSSLSQTPSSPFPVALPIAGIAAIAIIRTHYRKK